MQDMMGGFFGLELPEFHNFPYQESAGCAFVNSGRAALEVLLLNRPRPARLWVPHYICDTVLQAPARLEIPVSRYSCTEALAPILPAVAQDEVVLLVNYFGLTEQQVAAAAASLPGQCIVDATTALYSPPIPGIPTFYSPRKFAGIADGGVAISPEPLKHLPAEQCLSSDTSIVLLQRLESGAAAALPASERAEAALNSPPLRMSTLTRSLLGSIDFSKAAARRMENFHILHAALGHLNRLPLPAGIRHAPMCYPLVCGIPNLRDELIDAGIALPVYWAEVIEHTDYCSVENRIARSILPLPIDQRYKKTDMERIIELILC
ncbi:MAG: hypothetical protein IKA23_07250 [Akkermansia sp.]|nr:hypothetical protein [Akkermansia sp.]